MDVAAYWVRRGKRLRYAGRFGAAIECFERALALKPTEGEAHRMIALSRGSPPDDAQVDELVRLRADGSITLSDRIDLSFALAKLYDDQGNYPSALECYIEANGLQRKFLESNGQTVDVRLFREYVNRSIELYSKRFFDCRASWGNPTKRPVFIVGMPRSGTSLVEDLLSRHKSVFCAGELTRLPRAIKRLSAHGPAYGALNALAWTRNNIATCSLRLEKYLCTISGGAPVVVDKLPDNVCYLGVIALLFPNSRIIVCVRSRPDNALSCYFQKFERGNYFSYRLAHCAGRYDEVHRLQAHWSSCLPLQTLTVCYEDMVRNFGAEALRLAAFLALDWEPASLLSGKRRRYVKTASAWQVRQPIYATSVNRSKHYLPLLLSRGGLDFDLSDS